MSHDHATPYGYVSPQLDELSSTLIGNALDMLADGATLGVLIVIQSSNDNTESLQLLDDGPDRLLEEAHDLVRGKRGAQRYAIAYEGAIADGDSYADALIVEFGEKGQRSYSAFCLYEGKGTGDDFRWTDPAPAGEEEALLG